MVHGKQISLHGPSPTFRILSYASFGPPLKVTVPQLTYPFFINMCCMRVRADDGNHILPADSFNQPESRIRHPIFRQIFEQYLREKNIILDHTIELWSIPTIKNLVKNNVGISYLPTFTVEEELGTGELEAIHTDIGDKTITAVCVHHKNKWLSPLMQLFIDLCVSISA